MDEGDVEPFEIVFAIQGPMGFDFKHLCPFRHQAHAVERKPADPFHHFAKIQLRAIAWCHLGKQERPPLEQRHAVQVVARCRKIFYILELRHKRERAVQLEHPSVIAAAQLTALARFPG